MRFLKESIDDVPESYFLNAGTIDDVRAKYAVVMEVMCMADKETDSFR